MKETIRKAILIGIGSVYYSGKQLEKAVSSFAKEHNINKEEADKLIKELVEKGKTLKEEQQDNAEKMVKNMIKKSNLATKDEVKKLKKEISDLKKEIKSTKPKATTKVKKKTTKSKK